MSAPAFCAQPSIEINPFGTVKGTAVSLFGLTNERGAQAWITNYGGIVTRLMVPDRNGELGDIVLGYDNVDGYVKTTPYFGALIGRYGNRIANGAFELGGKKYQLAKNDGPNTLHGGERGFDKVIWQARPFLSKDGPALELAYLSADGEEGYPGNLPVKAIYTLTDKNELKLTFQATTDKPTVVNLTHHSYFNLAGQGRGDILNHIATIPANRFTPVSKTLIPTGELRPVAGTAFDFRKPHTIGSRIGDNDPQLKLGPTGYDHNWVFPKTPGKLTRQARVTDPKTGRVMEVFSTKPGMQFYSGNFLDGSIKGKGGASYGFRSGFCMEPQHFPDSPNHPSFPSTVLQPGETYKNTIIYRFSAE